MTLSSCTYGGATSGRESCTPVGATSQTEVRSTLHLYMCNIQRVDLAPPLVQHTLHPRWFNNEYPYLLTHSRHALACKTDVNPYRIIRRLILTYPTTKVTTDRVRGGGVVAHA